RVGRRVGEELGEAAEAPVARRGAQRGERVAAIEQAGDGRRRAADVEDAVLTDEHHRRPVLRREPGAADQRAGEAVVREGGLLIQCERHRASSRKTDTECGYL